MPVEGEIDEAELRLRTHLGDGEIEGEEFQISLNADNQEFFVEFDDERVMYSTRDMVIDAYEKVYGEPDVQPAIVPVDQKGDSTPQPKTASLKTEEDDG